MKTGVVHKTYDVLVVVFFMVMISLPLASAILSQDKEWSNTEKRVLVKFPNLPDRWGTVPEFLQNFEEYYNDHFGFRELFIYRYQRELEKRFDISGSPQVLKGEGKWLFFLGSDLLEDFRGHLRLSNADLERWLSEQNRRYRWLQDRGIAYLTFSPPNKQTIYSEFMPKEFHKIKGTSRMSQLHDFLGKKTLPFYIDLQERMKQAKPQKKLYFAMDTHWNKYGAYIAFRGIMDKIQQQFPEEKYDLNFPFHQDYFRATGGDLAKMLMTDKDKMETMPMVRFRHYCSKHVPFDIRLSNIGTQKHEKPMLKKCNKATLKAVIFCDSFIVHLQPFLSENFSEVLYLRKEYDEANVIEVMKKFKPDIVIDERVERNFFRQIIDDWE